MRVALLSRNARCADAIGAQVVAKVTYFQQLGSELRVYLSEADSLRPEVAALHPFVGSANRIWRDAEQQEYLVSCDLILAEYGAAYDLMNLLPALAGQGPRIVVDYRGVTPVELGDAGLQAELEAAARQRALLWCADAVMVQSQFAAEELQQSIGLPRERMHQIPCWIAPSSEQETEIVQRLRDKHGLQGARVVLFVGRLAANKQPKMVIEALSQLGDDVHAVFVGCQIDAYREQLNACQQLARDRQITQQVHFIGSASEAELAGWYRTAEVLVLPSRHECFGMPVVEAMQRGTPVVGSDTGSLPEVIGHAGLTCSVDDAKELAQQIGRFLTLPSTSVKRRVALVTHRFGTQFAGGAEKSLRLMARAFQSQGYVVEIFTTCNEHESRWANKLPGGTSVEDDFTVHRFAIDGYDSQKLGQAYETIRRADGRVSEKVEQQYLENSLGSKQLIEALSTRRTEFTAILTGPYLFKLMYEAAKVFGEQVLLAPCFHDEPLARLAAFQKTYRQVGGLLFHTETEARYAADRLAINHPRHAMVGTILDESAFVGDAQRGQARVGSEQYLVYCGRYCPEKGLDRLLQYMEEMHVHGGSGIKLVCLGQGPMQLPSRPWLVDRGFVSEEVKRDVIAGALGLVNLSRNESLSIVALEAWALGVPVIVDSECAVLLDQINKAQGGVCIKNSAEFTAIIHQWCRRTEAAKVFGNAGNQFVRREYAMPEHYAQRLEGIVQSLRQPLSEVARTQGIKRSELYSADCWQQRLSAILEQVSLAPSTAGVINIGIESLQQSLMFAAGMPSGTLTLRLCNRGQTVLATSGPARTEVVLKVLSTSGKLLSRSKMILPTPLIPGLEQLMVASIELPQVVGRYRVQVRLKQGKRLIANKKLKMMIGRMDIPHQPGHAAPHALGPMLQTARNALSQAKRMEKLPEDYVDVTEGKLANLKRSLKRKLLNNFRKAYVDVAFHQQSALNEKLIAVMSLLLETVSAQETPQTLADMERRLQRLERDLKRERLRNERLTVQLEQLTSPDVSLMEGA